MDEFASEPVPSKLVNRDERPPHSPEPRMIGPVTARFLASSAVSLLGNSVAGVVLPLVLLATTGDVLAAGALALICMVPQALAGVLGGAALDRLNRRDVSVASDIVSAVSVAMLPVVDATVGLDFGWFVLFGLMGAIGDVPGMTARDALLPAVCERDGVDMQRFVGLSQSADSLVTIIGPAIAALFMGFAGATNALVVTACTSAAAAFVTLSIPRATGEVPPRGEAVGNPVRLALGSTREGLRTLFASGSMLRSTIVFTLFMLVAMAGYQGLILPVHFTLQGEADLLGYVLSAMSAGILVGSLAYAQLATRLSNRSWYVVSLMGMMAGMAVMAALPPFPLLVAGAAVLGLFSGPFSALLGYRMLALIPDEVRGATLGTQNALMLMVAPAAVFVSAFLVDRMGLDAAAVAIAAIWAAFTVYALLARGMRSI